MSASIVPHISLIARPTGPVAEIAQGATHRLAALAAALHCAWRRRRDRHALEAMGDRALADIGIGHGEIEHAVRHGRDETGTVRTTCC